MGEEKEILGTFLAGQEARLRGGRRFLWFGGKGTRG